MGYTKFALRYLVRPGEIMPQCTGDRVVEIDIAKSPEFILSTGHNTSCLFVISPIDYKEAGYYESACNK